MSKPMETYSTRKSVIAFIHEAQSFEHAYYRAAAVSVRKHMQALTAAWIAMLKEQLKNVEHVDISRFCTAAGISKPEFQAWCSAAQASEQASQQLTYARDALSIAEAGRSNFSGTLWGARKGYEREYAASDQVVKNAKSALLRQTENAAATADKLDAISEALLRTCIRQSAHISTSAEFGGDIARVLKTMQVDALELERQHNEQQQQLLASVANAVNVLANHYSK